MLDEFLVAKTVFYTAIIKRRPRPSRITLPRSQQTIMLIRSTELVLRVKYLPSVGMNDSKRKTEKNK